MFHAHKAHEKYINIAYFSDRLRIRWKKIAKYYTHKH
jgi:hypothetical protein